MKNLRNWKWSERGTREEKERSGQGGKVEREEMRRGETKGGKEARKRTAENSGGQGICSSSLNHLQGAGRSMIWPLTMGWVDQLTQLKPLNWPPKLE